MNVKLLSLLFLWLFFVRNNTIDYKNILLMEGIKEPFIRVFDFFKSKISDAWHNHKTATIFTVAGVGVGVASVGAVKYLKWREEEKRQQKKIVLNLTDFNYLKDNNVIKNTLLTRLIFLKKFSFFFLKI